MTRRNLLTSLLGLLAAWWWKPAKEKYVGHVVYNGLAKTLHSVPQGSLGTIEVYRDGKPIEVRQAKFLCASMPGKWVLVQHDVVTAGEC